MCPDIRVLSVPESGGIIDASKGQVVSLEATIHF
jgi:hypothetical protein